LKASRKFDAPAKNRYTTVDVSHARRVLESLTTHLSDLLDRQMPFYLTSTANPSSPQSWVKMETESIVSMNSEYGQLRFHPAATTNPRQPLQFPPLTSPSGSLSPRVVGNGLDYHDQPRRPSPLQNQNLGSSFNSFSLNRNLNRLNLAVVPRTNRYQYTLLLLFTAIFAQKVPSFSIFPPKKSTLVTLQPELGSLLPFLLKSVKFA